MCLASYWLSSFAASPGERIPRRGFDFKQFLKLRKGTVLTVPQQSRE